MADSVPKHPEECCGGTVSSDTDSAPTGTACSVGCAVAGVTCNSAGNRSKASGLSNWVNAYLGTTYGNEEDQSAGAGYCQFTDVIFAGAVSLSKVNMKGMQGGVLMQNFKVLREAF
ncbi:hypothetical protein HPB50_000650 [Hyalomma asiaticum]|uniref:Uncharacterized protein n=1 Tax=Hyalomma asiaticum TaxID=266040 RepID=A0ACB7T9V0_HYAAI|nr:hypothetical protein HPB50_000650 [Hyalomma asiaticum]